MINAKPCPFYEAVQPICGRSMKGQIIWINFKIYVQ